MNIRTGLIAVVLFFTRIASAQQSYPQQYFRHPLNIRMELVANFGEIRTNHWHMGLDIRTQQRVNLPVYASADGYISRILVEPGGFGQAIYIDHPNGYTTLYAHLNSFVPAVAAYVKKQQYEIESWHINLTPDPGQFPVKKGELIAYSGSTGGSQGPHVHFEIRDTKTENCLNPLLFKFPIPDGVPPSITRLALYDRNRSTYDQAPQLLAIRKSGNTYTITNNALRVGSNKISFAVGAVDRFTGTPNPNGIYSAQIFLDGQPISGFLHDDISYPDSRYINAQLDYPYKSRGGADLQHISPLPGAQQTAYHFTNSDGLIHLTDDKPHEVLIEVRDAAQNLSTIRFKLTYDPSLAKTYPGTGVQQFYPNHLNIFEREDFELFTTEQSMYDTASVQFTRAKSGAAAALSPLYTFLSPAIPSHDAVTVRIRLDGLDDESRDRVVIRNTVGSRTYLQKAVLQQNGWASAKFRQFGSYQAFIDKEPPTVNNPPLNLSKSSRIVFTPTDNFKVIKRFRVELDGRWLCFTNDKGRSWIYYFDDKFPRGRHELKATIEDEAGNITEKTWTVTR